MPTHLPQPTISLSNHRHYAQISVCFHLSFNVFDVITFYETNTQERQERQERQYFYLNFRFRKFLFTKSARKLRRIQKLYPHTCCLHKGNFKLKAT